MQTVFETLRQDHDLHRRLLASLAATSGDTPERREQFARLKQDLVAHAAAEERVLYSPMLGTALGREKSAHSIHEHEQLDALLAELDEIDFSSPAWLPKLKALRHEVEHHEAEEEQEVFQLAGRVLDDATKRRLALHFERTKTEELERV